MSIAFFILMLGAMLAVLGVLALGIFSMAKGGEFNRKYSNSLMRARLVLQGGALVFFLLAAVAFKR